jgi:hypothetical protein
MVVAQVGSFAAGFEAARVAGVQQSSQSAAVSATQRQTSEEAEEAGLRKTEVVEESNSTDSASSAGERRLDITV